MTKNDNTVCGIAGFEPGLIEENKMRQKLSFSKWIVFLASTAFCSVVIGADLKLDVIEKIVTIPNSVRFNCDLSVNDVEKHGVLVDLRQDEVKALMQAFNAQKRTPLKMGALDIRTVIFARNGNRQFRIAVDRWMDRSNIDGKLFRLVGGEHCGFAKCLSAAFSSRKEKIESDYQVKTFGSAKDPV